MCVQHVNILTAFLCFGTENIGTVCFYTHLKQTATERLEPATMGYQVSHYNKFNCSVQGGIYLE